MIHFDIPWSLMTFQQRNGRIDRYGQTEVPQIRYMQTMAENEKAIGDARVLERLWQKDEQAQHNLSDPAEFLMTQEEQENRTAAQMEGRELEETTLAGDIFDFFNTEVDETAQVASPIAPVMTEADYQSRVVNMNRLYTSDMEFAKAVLRWMNEKQVFNTNELDLSEDHRILLGIPKDLKARLKYLPAEVLPESNRFDLTDDPKRVQEEMKRVRSMGDVWPTQTLLWALHPVMHWLQDRALGMFGRHTAPVLRLSSLAANERWALLQGGYPNRRGYIPIHQWVVVREKDGVIEQRTLDDLISDLALDSRLSNLTQAQEDGQSVECTEEFKTFVKASVDIAQDSLEKAKKAFDQVSLVALNNRVAELDRLRQQHLEQMELDVGNLLESVRKSKEDALRHQIEQHFKDAEDYITNTATTEDEPYLQLVAVFAGLKD